MIHALILEAALFVPLVFAAISFTRAWEPVFFKASPWAALPALLAALFVPAGKIIEWPWLVLGTRFGLDETGRVFLFFTALLWLLAGIYGWTYLAEDRRRSRFFKFYVLALSGNAGLILSLDIASFYTFFALMSFASYGLVVHERSAEALRAGRIYIYLVVMGELMLFAAFVLIAANAGSMELPVRPGGAVHTAAIGLALFGFGIKAGLLPLHVWLPLAHPVAPTPASAVLSGAMIKAGLIGWLRFLPPGDTAAPGWGNLLLALGITAAFYGVLIGLMQRNPKTVLAYSSISQMGFMTLAVGAGFSSPANGPAWLTAVLFYAIHHGLAKGALFLGVGVAHAAGEKSRNWVRIGLVLPALALAGAPLTSGVAAKAALKPVTAGLAGPWPDLLAILLPLAALGTTLVMIRFLYLVWPRETGKGHLTAGLWVPWLLLILAAALTLFVWPRSAELARNTLSPAKWPEALWPVLLGIAIAAGIRPLRRFASRLPEIPAGDLLAWAERLGAQLAARLPVLGPGEPGIRYKGTRSLYAGYLQESNAAAGRAEGVLGKWQAAALALLALTLAIRLLLV